jgi:Na+/proline symporter
VQAVTWTDVKQMAVIIGGVLAAVVILVMSLPGDVGVGQALHLAGATGRLESIDFSFRLDETYTFWSGMLGGLFLMLSYFGCDQSQVQRYLTARSIKEGRDSLMMSAFAKIPLQALILLTGVLVFVFYLFNEPPMLFNPIHHEQVRTERGAEFEALENEFRASYEARRQSAHAAAAARRSGDPDARATAMRSFREEDTSVSSVRNRAVRLVRETTGDMQYNDVNYVFPTFITTKMPVGLVGLMIAAIFAAAMSSIAAELNSLATASVIDFYRRYFRKQESDRHYLLVSKLATGFWGLFACWVAIYATSLGSLIEVVNRFGSFFYGSILGVFALAILTERATGTGAFVGLVAGMAVVAGVAFGRPEISFLWHNVIGAGVVFVVGLIVSLSSSIGQTGRG